MLKKPFLKEVQRYCKLTTKQALEAWNNKEERGRYIADIILLYMLEKDINGNPIVREDGYRPTSTRKDTVTPKSIQC